MGLLIREQLASLGISSTSRSMNIFRKLLLTGCILGAGALIGAMLVSIPSSNKDGVAMDGAIKSSYGDRQKRTVDVAALNRTPNPSGVMFTRWGRTVCPPDATLVYEGLMASGHKDQSGGSPEYLCMTKHPEWGPTTPSVSGRMYGVEFSTVTNDIFNKDNAPNVFTHQDAVCAVCRSSRSVQLMIPAKRTCFEGWTPEYHGYLMGSTYGDKTQRIAVCMDNAPEADDKGARSDVSSYLYPMSAMCGALACPHYKVGHALTCVVCTQ